MLTGQYYDIEIAEYYLHARQYDPRTEPHEVGCQEMELQILRVAFMQSGSFSSG